MSKSQTSDSNFDSTIESSSAGTLDKAMIKSTESSDLSDFSDNNNCAVFVREFTNEAGATSADSSVCEFSRHSIILAGSHKQNACTLSTENDSSFSVSETKKHSEKVNTQTLKNVCEVPVPRIVVTSATPQKSPSRLNLGNTRSIVSPVAQYVQGKGVVKGRKIVIK